LGSGILDVAGEPFLDNVRQVAALEPGQHFGIGSGVMPLIE
jgi:hypothetical protein